MRPVSIGCDSEVGYERMSVGIDGEVPLAPDNILHNVISLFDGAVIDS